MTVSKGPHLLMTGALGGLAKSIAQRLSKRYQVVGIDPRKQPGNLKFPGTLFRYRYNDYALIDLFKSYDFEVVLHMGRIRSTVSKTANYRFLENVYGTRNLLNLCSQNSVKTFIVISTYHVYGAHQYNHFYLKEDEPLRATHSYPELADAIELDHSATSFMLQHPQINTMLLRPCWIVGKNTNNLMSRLLRSKFAPTVLGYDPPMQFIHEEDMASAIFACMENSRRGVYNVAGEGVIPYSSALDLAGCQKVMVPRFLFKSLSLQIPEHLTDYFRFPTIIDDKAFRTSFAIGPQKPMVEVLGSVQRR